MEFLILGPLDARLDGRGLPLGGTAARAAGAAAAAPQRNRLDRPADRWHLGEAPPATAAKVVQVYVSRLRKLLGPSAPDGGRLVTRPPGYMLQVAPDELDLDRFAIVVESRWSPPTTERSAPASEYPDHPPAAPIEHWPAFPGVISVR